MNQAQNSTMWRYWGKAKPADANDGDRYHLLPFHSLDVAACGWVLMSDDYPWAKKISESLGIPAAQFRRIFTFFLALHDLGKFARGFQSQVTGLSDDLVAPVAGYSYKNEKLRHDSMGFLLWLDGEELQAVFSEHFGSERIYKNKQLKIWFEIVTGHHGKPPQVRGDVASAFFHRDDIKAATDFASEVISRWLLPEDLKIFEDKTVEKKLKEQSWLLAGLAVLADWQGSNQTYFPYRARPLAFSDYWNDYAVPSAINALEQAGLSPRPVTEFKDIRQLFPFISKPTPLQRYAIEQPLSDKPQLFILEDVTGAGKTEAALTLVSRLMNKGLADGLYVALPTMATANAMYARMSQCYQSLYQANQQPSLVLAHGATHLSESFMKSVDHQPKDNNNRPDEMSASSYCNSWIADSRKKSLLADVGVGTVDQALLAILPSKHQSLRVLGLGRKILLVDEVHAYDHYMRTLLVTLLKLHASQGGSAILLSATLPAEMKQEFVKAYAEGAVCSEPSLQSQAYPLATHLTCNTGDVAADESPLETRAEVKRNVQVVRKNDTNEVFDVIRDAVQRGQCVCWIRNTVDDARQSYSELKEALSDTDASLHLFHSRFAMIDRQKIENDVLAWYGKESNESMRKGRVLIATQVVEQSLDLDADVLISDLAPVDLLLQRAGRLHRHVRDSRGNILKMEGGVDATVDRRSAPTFFVHSPKPVEDAGVDWLSSLRGTQAVYGDVGVLWRSAKVLFQNVAFRMPDDARYLIESVYGPEPGIEPGSASIGKTGKTTRIATPEALADLSVQVEGKQLCHVSTARLNALKIEKGYCSGSSDSGWYEETSVPTRLSDQSASVVLVRKDDSGRWQPYAQGMTNAWDMSALQVRDYKWDAASKEIPAALQRDMAALKELHPALRWHELLPLDGELSAWYSPVLGWCK